MAAITVNEVDHIYVAVSEFVDPARKAGLLK
jgi:hypothetical protein